MNDNEKLKVGVISIDTHRLVRVMNAIQQHECDFGNICTKSITHPFKLITPTVEYYGYAELSKIYQIRGCRFDQLIFDTALNINQYRGLLTTSCVPEDKQVIDDRKILNGVMR